MSTAALRGDVDPSSGVLRGGAVPADDRPGALPLRALPRGLPPGGADVVRRDGGSPVRGGGASPQQPTP